MKHYRLTIILSILLAILIMIGGLTALETPGFYQAETPNWQLQSRGQDIINLLLICPALLVAVYFGDERKWALHLIGGIAFYLVYTFTIYCFDIHFNKLFLVYCASLGLSAALSILYLVNYLSPVRPHGEIKPAVAKWAGIYFILLAVMFSIAWLADIVPAMRAHTVPPSITDAGLLTNPVHVIDLSILLPGFLITGISLLRNRSRAYDAIPAMLYFLCCMDITIAALAWMMRLNGFPYTPVPVILGLSLLCISAVFLRVYFRVPKSAAAAPSPGGAVTSQYGIQ